MSTDLQDSKDRDLKRDETKNVRVTQLSGSRWFGMSASALFLVAALVMREKSPKPLQQVVEGLENSAEMQMKSHAVSRQAWESPETSLRDYVFLKNRVMVENDWTQARAEGAIVEYLRFMQLLAEAPRMELVASSDIDEVWHEHLIDTQNYAVDSQQLWGRFLHHRRARTLDEFGEIPVSYAKTKLVYEQRFGQAPPAEFWGAETKAASMCGGGGAVDPSQSGPATPASESNVSSNVDSNAQSQPEKTGSSSNASNSSLATLVAITTAAALFANSSLEGETASVSVNSPMRAASRTHAPKAAVASLFVVATAFFCS